MKIMSSFILPQVVPNLYEFLSSSEHKRRYCMVLETRTRHNLRVSEWWQNFHFCVNYPFNVREAMYYFKLKYFEFKTAHLNLWKLPIIPLHITNPWQMDRRCPFHLFSCPSCYPCQHQINTITKYVGNEGSYPHWSSFFYSGKWESIFLCLDLIFENE